MSRSFVTSDGVVADVLNKHENYLLDNYILQNKAIPVEVFGATRVAAISDGIDYLTSVGGGRIFVPADGTHFELEIRVHKDRNGAYHTNFEYHYDRQPTTEARPYTDEEWQVGDTIFNSQPNIDKCMGWVCTTAGTPGTWTPFGWTKRFFSEIEVVDSLPDPNELQLGRQLLLQVSDESTVLYYCIKVGETYKWERQINLPIVDSTLTQSGSAADARVVGNKLAQEVADRKAEIEVERSRINQFTALAEGSTTGDAELLDLRVSADGKTYDTAGDAVREQIKKVTDIVPVDVELLIEGVYPLSGEYVGVFTPHDSRMSQKIEVSAGDTFLITGTGSSTYKLYAFTDSEGKIDTSDGGSITGGSGVQDRTIIAKSNGFLYVNFDTTKNHSLYQYVKLVQLNQQRLDKVATDDWFDIEYLTTAVYNTSNIGESVGDSTISDDYRGQKIKVSAGDTFRITGKGGGNLRLWAFTDTNNEIVRHSKPSAVATDSIIVATTDGYLYVHFDCTRDHNLYKRKSFILGLAESNQQSVNQLTASNSLYGKNYVAAGDSYTEWSDATYADGIYYGKNVTYDREIRLRNRMTGDNAGKSGSTMALAKGTASDKETVDKNAFSNTRYTNIPDDTDILTIAFGINDASLCDLGELGDTENTTFYGAWDKVLKYYAENRPEMKIGIICFARSNNSFYNAVKEIAKHYGVPLLDFYGGEDTPMYVDGKAPMYIKKMVDGEEIEVEYPDEHLRETKRNFWCGHKHTAGETEVFRGKTYNMVEAAEDNEGHPGYRAHIDESTIIESFLRRL